MTRRYERPDYLGGSIISFTVYPGNSKDFTVSDGETTKTVSVKDTSVYVYKLGKTSISANGGATALYKYIDKCLFNGFCDCLAWKVLNHVLLIGK